MYRLLWQMPLVSVECYIGSRLSWNLLWLILSGPFRFTKKSVGGQDKLERPTLSTPMVSSSISSVSRAPISSVSGTKADGGLMRRLAYIVDLVTLSVRPTSSMIREWPNSLAKKYERAIQLLRRALELYRTVDHPLGLAHAHSNLAAAEMHIGAQRASADNLEEARVLYQDLGNRLGEINVMVRLGQNLRQHEPDRATEILNEAVKLSINIGNPLARINALAELGEIHSANGDMKAAANTWSRALEIASDHGIGREVDKLAAKIGRVR